MKSQDTIKFIGNLLYINFDVTGLSHRASVFNLDTGITFFVEGAAVKATSHSGEQRGNLIVETFVVESQAWKALEHIQKRLWKRSEGRRWVGIGKDVCKFVALPLGILFLVAGISANLSNRQAQPVTGNHEQFATGSPALPLSTAAPTFDMRTTEQLSAKPEQIAPALKQGASSGRYAVKIGTATGADPVYVFEDPQCEYCQAFTPELQKLAKKRPVYVIPVSAIGGVSSAELNAQVLCAATERREAAWSAAMTGAMLFKDPAAKSTYTPDCKKAADANDLIYQVIGIHGTPALFDAKGRKLPDKIDHTAEAISQWLSSES
jgi:TrbB protein